LLVAGVNYPRISQGNVLDPKLHRTYFKFCLNHKDYLLGNAVVTRVLIFDFLMGEIRAYKKGGAAGGTLVKPDREKLIINNYRYNYGGNYTLTKPASNAPWDERRRLYYTGMHELAKALSGKEDADVDQSKYDAERGKRFAKEKSLSVKDVYATIKSAPPSSIREVHFFGHAFAKGPIIVDCPGDNKKEYDKDARISDFTSNELSAIFDSRNISFFRSAFTSDAFLMVWGCEDDDSAKQLVIQAKGKLAKQQKIDKEIVDLQKLLDDNYAHHLARAAGKPVYAALPGTYAVNEGEPNDDDDASNRLFSVKLMHVNLSKCGHILSFYKKNLKASFPTNGINKGHPEFGRGYAIYAP